MRRKPTQPRRLKLKGTNAEPWPPACYHLPENPEAGPTPEQQAERDRRFLELFPIGGRLVAMPNPRKENP